MATTNSLNSEDTVYVTTFYGGPIARRAYVFTSNQDGEQIEVILTEGELHKLLKSCPHSSRRQDKGQRPEFDNK